MLIVQPHIRVQRCCVNKQTESAWIKSLSNVAVWIGYTDMPPEGHQAVSLDHSITNWNAAEPKNAGGEDCIIINDGGRWDDRSCQSNI
jgi:hypothetical protein